MENEEREKRAERLANLSENTRDFWVSSSIPRLVNPSPIQFLREAVLSYHPVILSGVIDHWPALSSSSPWDFSSLKTKCKGSYSVNITPNGLADCVSDGEEGEGKMFFYPAEVMMTLDMLFDMLSNREDDDAIPYLSQQNNNLINHFSELLDDIESSLPLAAEAFGTPTPEAVNLWIGDERSVSSLHKDHFENMYAVISGEKVFTLFPPSDFPFLGEKVFQTRRYVHQNSSMSTHPLTHRPKQSEMSSTREGCPSAELPWIAIDPESPAVFTEHPPLKLSSPLRVKVRPGEVLYIPSMWYHRVSQTMPTIAVNFWYEQNFNFRYVFYQLCRGIAPVDSLESELALRIQEKKKAESEE